VRQAYDKFYKHAEKGLWTRQYRKNVGWGYFALPSWVQYDLLQQVSLRAYPTARSGDENLTSDIDLYNHVLTALKDMIQEEGIRSEEEMDLNMTCSLVVALQTYYSVVVSYGVSVSPALELAKALRPPQTFEDLLPKVDEEEEEIPIRLPTPARTKAAKKELFPEPPKQSDPENEPLEDYEGLLDDDDEPEDTAGSSSSKADESTMDTSAGVS